MHRMQNKKFFVINQLWEGFVEGEVVWYVPKFGNWLTGR